MKFSTIRAAVSLTAALSALSASFVAGAQSGYEFKTFKRGLSVTSAASEQGPGAGSEPGAGGSTPATEPALELSTASIDFGDVATNTTKSRQVLVSNPGTGALMFTASPAVTGAAAFVAGTTSCGATLAAGANCVADINFSPTAVGSFSGTLTFTSALASSPHEVTLVGAAFNPVSLASANVPTAMVGKAYSYDFKQLLAVSNETSPDKSLASWSGSGILPAGLSFSASTGVLSGTPTSFAGPSTYTVTTTYRGNSGTQAYTLRVGDPAIGDGVSTAGACASGAATGCTALKFIQDSGMTFSNANRTLTLSQNWRRGTTAAMFKNSGKWYVEFTQAGSPSDAYFGVSEQASGFSTSNPAVSSVNWRKRGGVYANGVVVSNVASFGAGDVIGIALDMDNKMVSFFKNCQLQYTGPVPLGAGSYAPFVTLEGVSSSTIKTGDVNFTCQVPEGYYAGLY